jgi:hypothetical protein
VVAEPVDADDELRNLAVELQGGCGPWLEHGLPLIAPLGMNLLKGCVAKFQRAGAISESHSVTEGASLFSCGWVLGAAGCNENAAMECNVNLRHRTEF